MWPITGHTHTFHQISVFTADSAKKNLVFLQNALNIIKVYALSSELIQSSDTSLFQEES